MIAVILVCAVAAVALLTAAFAMPDTRIRAHLTESATNRVFLENLAYEFIIDGQLLTFTDNHADARFLMSACNWNTDTQTAMQRAMEAAFPNVDGILFRPQSLHEIFAKGATNYTLYPYARYWHGIQLVMRPLLFFFTYAQIGTLNGIVQALLLGIILMLMAKRGLRLEAVAFCVALTCIGAYIFSASISLSICYYIFLAAMILMLTRHEWLMQSQRYLFFFLGLGIATAFFDTLTWPTVTFGVPMILYALLTHTDDLWKRVKTIVALGASWVFGYLAFWACKWPISRLITGNSTMDTVEFNIGYHLGGGGATTKVEPTIVNALKKLIYPYNTPVMWLLVAICAILLGIGLFRFFRSNPSRETRRACLCRIVTLAFCCLIPFAWYAVVRNHSIVHNLNFPDRLMLMTLWGSMCIIAALFSASAKKPAPSAPDDKAQTLS